MFQPTAKIIADSVNPNGDRLTTFEIKLHRYVLAEFNTHRVNSRNFQSSRACPVERMIANILKEDEMVYPLHWGRKQKGMVADLEIDEADQLEAIAIWDEARKDMIRHVRRLLEIDVHKQVANRLLEPFMAITGIVTATDYSNFFAQRCHPDAQPEIQALANAMKAAYDASVPERLEAGEWHLPLINGADWVDATDRGYVEEDMIKVSIGRCARVSYLNHDGLRSLSDDTKLYWRLLEADPPHLSPFEHCAMALGKSEKRANFTGFEAYRFQLEESLKC
jgi:thymidylate synthase ThyX